MPFSEDDRVDFPVSYYAATKKANELMAASYANLYKLPLTGLRFFTVYGPWGRPDMAPWLFTDAILAGRPIKVFNNGDMMRDFTFIDDIVEGVVRVIGRVPQGDFPYEIFNIGNHSPVRLMDFIHEIEKACGREAEKIMLPMQAGDVPVTYADTAKLERVVLQEVCASGRVQARDAALRRHSEVCRVVQVVEGRIREERGLQKALRRDKKSR